MTRYQITAKPTQQERVVKLEANHFLSPYRAFKYTQLNQAEESPLATELLKTDLIKLVYIAENYVAVQLKEEVNIDSSGLLSNLLQDFLNNGGALFKEGVNPKPRFIPIELYTEMTPSPGILKFVCNRKLVIEDREFNFNQKPIESPLARALFEFDYVKRVKFSNNHILITKGGRVSWDEVMMELRDFLRNYLMRLKPVL